MRTGALLICVLVLSGCAGKPTTYLALAPTGTVQPQSLPAVPVLAVSAVDIPPAIDRLHFTTGTAPGVLHVAGDTVWAGPLGPMARIVLAQDLAARLRGSTVLMPGDALPPGGAATLHVTIQSFMPDEAGTVSLQADWSVAAPDGKTILARGRFAHTMPGGSQPAAEAQTMSTALGGLADAIATALMRAA
ncbi:MAG TPA: PqiC family protein [Acidocella sp.]|nr:PqiC family protein [Acidocella sp.]